MARRMLKARDGDITIAIDAMGGDSAPRAVILGAQEALVRYPNLKFRIFGDRALVQPLLDRCSDALRDACELVHTDDYITGEDPPASAIRRRRSSLSLAIDAVKNREVDAVISAGNTGAFMALSYIKLKTLEGIDRPAIASFFPTLRGEACMLDLGANLKCTVDNLVQFAVMGNVFARLVLGVLYPSYGLLNVGTETLKGPAVIQDAAERLQQLSDASQRLESGGLPGRFIGYVEGDGVAAGAADVVVTDGFTGNIALKMGEGTARLTTEYIRQTFRASIIAQIGYLFASRAMRKLRYRLDPRRYNGAVFLGLSGIAVKSHGGTDPTGFANALGVAADMVRYDLQQQITEEIRALNGLLGSLPGATAAAQPPSSAAPA